MCPTGPSSTTSSLAFPEVDWDRDVIQTPVECPECGRMAVRLDIVPWGISPIACDFCSEEWERAEGLHEEQTRAGAFEASGIPAWATSLSPDDDALDAFMADFGSRGVRAKWIQCDSPDAATNAACRLLRAWMNRKDANGAYRTGAYVMETAVYSKEGIGAAAGAGMLVIDGFGRRAPSRYEAGRLREIVESRRIGRKPLVIASTLDIVKAGDVVGKVSGEGTAAMEAIVSMLRGAV